MKRKVIFLVILGAVVIGIIGVLFLMGVIKPQQALLRVESSPQALVYVNGVEIGITPVEKDFGASEATVKLVPQAETPLSPYEVKINLTSGVKTIIKRNIGQTSDTSSGIIVSFEKDSGRDAPISVVSTPDGAQVKIDNQTRGVAPIKISDLSVSTHQLNVSAMGYNDENISIQNRAGYRLTAVVSLAANGGPTQPNLIQPSPTPQPSERSVEILTTPTGFLRVRSEPSTLGEEVIQVKPGEKYNYLEEKEDWVKIEIDSEKQGWISAEYAKITP